MNQRKVYLFDWGDTLMVDFPDQQGKMCDWPELQTVPNARNTLKNLSGKVDIYVATNAENSTEADIFAAFDKAELAQFIKGYFCQQRLGVGKNDPQFYTKIVNALAVYPNSVTMIGDSLEKDVYPALEAGINAIWFNPDQRGGYGGKQIHSLSELITLNSG